MDIAVGDYRDRLDIIYAAINTVNQRLERLYDALETGSLQLADLAPRIQRLRHKQEQLYAARLELENLLSDRKVELADIETVKSCVEELKNTLDDTSIIQRKSFIKCFVREVRVAGSEVSLDYAPPFLKGMMSRETFLVPPIVQHGGPYKLKPRTFSKVFTLML
ncbi:hypothetical protein ACFLVO_02070 [Chloroflexota bacterium]